MEPTFTAVIIILFFSLIASLLELARIKGINKKLTSKISDLEKKISEAQKKQFANLEEIRLLKWQISNPAKYKRGDKFGELTVKHAYVHKPSLSDFIAHAFMGLIEICAGFHRENKKSYSIDMYWEYHLIHEHHGDVIKKSESELTNIKSAENK